MASAGYAAPSSDGWLLTSPGRDALGGHLFRSRVRVETCSIVDGGTEIVVNASNDTATLGGGVSRAIYEECGGPILQAEMTEKLTDEFDGVLDEGDCLVTSAGSSSRFRFVLHVPSVDYRGPKAKFSSAGQPVRTVTSDERVRACTRAALDEADRLAGSGTLGVTLPLLGAGSGGLAPGLAARAMAEAVRAFFASSPATGVDRVILAVPAGAGGEQARVAVSRVGAR